MSAHPGVVAPQAIDPLNPPSSPPSQRPRPRSRGISFLSDKSRDSEGKPKYNESSRERAQRQSVWQETSKANPNAALKEAQPGDANRLEQSTLSSIRDYDHKDIHGNRIADPDRSNPTRPRMERPLDTIRSFEKAIDDGYSRRHSYMRQDAESWDQNNNFASRRSSYFGGEYAKSSKQRISTNDWAAGNENGQIGQNGHNGASPHRHTMQNGGGGYYGHQNYNGPPRAARYANNRQMQSDPGHYNQQRPYQQHGHNPSHDTVNTGMTNGSDSTGPWANSTDPSSENSSIDRNHAMNKSTPPLDGHPGYTNGYNPPIMEEQGANQYGDYPEQNGYDQYDYGRQDPHARQQAYYAQQLQNGNGGQQNGYGVQQDGYGTQDGYGGNYSAPPVQQPQPSSSGRRPIPLGNSGASNGYGSRGAPPAAAREEKQEKRKSWLSRRFSKG